MNELIPSMAMSLVYLNEDPSPLDDADIRALKTKKFPTKIHEGPNCVSKMLIQLRENLYEARDRILFIRSRYEKYKLSPAEEQRVKECKKCEKCFLPFDSKNRPSRDHSRVTDRSLRAIV